MCKKVGFVMYNATITGERIKKLRGKKTQDQCAKELGISRGALSYYENGERKPDAEILYRMAEHFKVSVDYLLGLAKEQTIEPDIKIACKVTGLTEEVIKKVSELDNNGKSALNYFISFEGIEEFFTLLSQIIITAADKRAFNFIYGDFWDEFQNEPSWESLDTDCSCFLSRYYSTYIYAPYNDFYDILYEEQIDLDHFKLNKVISKIVSQITTEILDRGKQEIIINEIEMYFQSKYNEFCDITYKEEEEDALLSEHDLKKLKQIEEIQINKFKKAKMLIDFLRSTLKD